MTDLAQADTCATDSWCVSQPTPSVPTCQFQGELAMMLQVRGRQVCCLELLRRFTGAGKLLAPQLALQAMLRAVKSAPISANFGQVGTLETFHIP